MVGTSITDRMMNSVAIGGNYVYRDNPRRPKDFIGVWHAKRENRREKMSASCGERSRGIVKRLFDLVDVQRWTNSVHAKNRHRDDGGGERHCGRHQNEKDGARESRGKAVSLRVQIFVVSDTGPRMGPLAGL